MSRVHLDLVGSQNNYKFSEEAFHVTDWPDNFTIREYLLQCNIYVNVKQESKPHYMDMGILK